MDKFYLKEFQFFDGENTVVFNIVAKKSLMHVRYIRCKNPKNRSQFLFLCSFFHLVIRIVFAGFIIAVSAIAVAAVCSVAVFIMFAVHAGFLAVFLAESHSLTSLDLSRYSRLSFCSSS